MDSAQLIHPLKPAVFVFAVLFEAVTINPIVASNGIIARKPRIISSLFIVDAFLSAITKR